MFGEKNENRGGKKSLLAKLKSFFTGKKDNSQAVFDASDLETEAAETAEQTDLSTYSRYTEEYREFLASTEQEKDRVTTPKAVPEDIPETNETSGNENGDAPEADK